MRRFCELYPLCVKNLHEFKRRAYFSTADADRGA
jgi:hypothetical protein